MAALEEKYEALKRKLGEYESLVLAFSGGVDSTLLLKVAHDVLGDKAVAVTAFLHSVPEFERRESIEFCKSEGIRHIICEINELELAEFVENGSERCYYCKKNIIKALRQKADELGIKHIAEGTNADDMGDFRPGRRAILEEGVLSPLLDAGLTKAEIRELSQRLELPTWNKPAYACLASRISHGETISGEKLRMVEKAEGFLMEKGFYQTRVRVHGGLARIEVSPEDIKKFISEDFRQKVTEKLKTFGFRYVSLDLEGYRTGSMNPKEAG